MDRRYSDLAVTLEEREEGQPAIRGVAAVYYREGDPTTEYRLWDGAVERIQPGAFDRAVAEDDVRALFNHDPSLILGRSKAGTLKLELQEDGLHYVATPSDTSIYRDVTEHLRRGDVDGSSFAFVATDVRWDKDGDTEVRTILQVSLYDVGPVTYPAYQATEAGYRDAREEQQLWLDELARREKHALEQHWRRLMADERYLLTCRN